MPGAGVQAEAGERAAHVPRHQGAASPANAGTNVTPPLSGTAPPTASSSPAPEITPRSVSQRTAEATVYTWPSRQWVTRPPSRQATQLTRPEAARSGAGPVCASRNAPVP